MSQEMLGLVYVRQKEDGILTIAGVRDDYMHDRQGYTTTLSKLSKLGYTRKEANRLIDRWDYWKWNRR